MAGYDVFSKRGKPLPDVFRYDLLPATFRRQVHWLLQRALSARGLENLLTSLRAILCEEHGLPYLAGHHYSASSDVEAALINSRNTELVFDIIDAAFGVMTAQPDLMELKPNAVIATLNHRFRENGLGYEFDPAARKLIRVDSTLVHAEAVRPSLALLADPRFATANTEMLEAWEDFRKSDFDDCLLKCGKALESTMKVVCDIKGWPYKQNDPAHRLVQTVIENGNLPPFFEQPLMTVVSLRNKFAAHGGGTVAHHVPEDHARYALNATSPAILLIAGLV